MIKSISAELTGAKKIVIAGHIRPDGDCIGSCTALYQYLNNNKESLGLEKADVYLEPFDSDYLILNGADEIKHTYESDESYDVFISLDSGSIDRLGNAIKYFDTAKKTINIDHHISNTDFADVNHVIADASSTCEVLYDLFEDELIDIKIAESLYVGIIHDTGVFKHSNTSEHTMAIAGRLMAKGIEFSRLIDESFYSKTYIQNQILGRCLMESVLCMDNKVLISSVNRKVLDFYDATSSDTDGIIDQLRVTKGVEVAVFIYESNSSEYKVSMRSNGDVNVSRIAVFYGGGGHVKAAGYTMVGTLHDVINNLLPLIDEQLNGGD